MAPTRMGKIPGRGALRRADERTDRQPRLHPVPLRAVVDATGSARRDTGYSTGWPAMALANGFRVGAWPESMAEFVGAKPRRFTSISGSTPSNAGDFLFVAGRIRATRDFAKGCSVWMVWLGAHHWVNRIGFTVGWCEWIRCGLSLWVGLARDDAGGFGTVANCPLQSDSTASGVMVGGGCTADLWRGRRFGGARSAIFPRFLAQSGPLSGHHRISHSTAAYGLCSDALSRSLVLSILWSVAQA